MEDEECCSLFTCSVEAHPYGVLPGGNRFFQGDDHRQMKPPSSTGYSPSILSTSNKIVWQSLDDELWQDILSFCDGKTLSLGIVPTCRRFYVLGHTPELWRDLVLRLQRDLDRMGPSWKDTYMMMMMMTTACSNADKAQPNSPPPLQQQHRPIPMAGIYSDYLFRSHLCRSFSIPPHWLQVDKIHDHNHHSKAPYSSPVPRVKNLSIQDFLEQYERPNRPVVIAGAARSWPATQKWVDPNYFAKLKQPQQNGTDNDSRRSNTTAFRATSGAAPLSAQFTLPAYLEYAHWDYLEEAPMYLFDRGALVPCPTTVDHDPAAPQQQQQHVHSLVMALQDDYLPSLRETLPFWDTTKCSDNGGHDLLQYLGEGKRPDHTWLIVGPRRSGSVFHIDPNATHAWNANIVGRKRWIFYPPGVPPPGVYPSDDGDEVTLPLSIGEWLINYYETEHAAAMSHGDDGPLECTAEAGDVVFVPHGWWHMVVNLDELNVAITHNYVSRSNLPNVLRFLRTQLDQISGCRDRPESIKPQDLYQAFCTALEEHHPQWLREALSVPDWTCRAWKTATTSLTTRTATKRTTFGRGKRKATRKESERRAGKKQHVSNCETTDCSNEFAKTKNDHSLEQHSSGHLSKNSIINAMDDTNHGFRFSFL